MNFAVLVVIAVVERHNLFGLIGDRPSLPKTIVANGKNFINATAVVFGGRGVLIDLPMNLPYVKNHKINKSKSMIKIDDTK